MQATFTDEQVALRQVAEDLSRRSRPANPQPWAHIPEDSRATAALVEGFGGLGVPEADGGSGGGLLELAIVLHELGRNIVPSSFSAHVMALQVAYGAGLDVTPALEGNQRWTLASAESGVSPVGPWSGVGGIRKRVPYGQFADAVVSCLDEDTVALCAGAVARPVEAFDITRPAADLELSGDIITMGPGARNALARAWVLNAAELVGVGRGAVELAAEYAKIRTQFGQPIAKFQGVAHQLSDAVVAVENAWSLVIHAAWSLDAGTSGALNAVHLAAGAASSAAVFAGERCTQVHGGIGVTWEALPHVFLRRAVAASSMLGTVSWHRIEAGRQLLSEVS